MRTQFQARPVDIIWIYYCSRSVCNNIKSFIALPPRSAVIRLSQIIDYSAMRLLFYDGMRNTSK